MRVFRWKLKKHLINNCSEVARVVKVARKGYLGRAGMKADRAQRSLARVQQCL